MTVPTPGLHSRSLLAGYDPDRLAAAKVVVVGLGALGQNLVQSLALVGVGRLLLVDHDVFESHNATRSPFYPTRAEVQRSGHGKAAIVAHRAAGVSTAGNGEVHYSTNLIQALGDGALAWADIVVSAVDNMNARAWLAERSRLLGKPMVEGGFSGPEITLSAFAPDKGAVCFRCSRPNRRSSMSCTAYALVAERQQIVPAIQTSAAILGGYQAELVVQTLHGDARGYGRRSYGNIRRPSLISAELTTDDQCPGIHEPQPVIGTVRGVDEHSTVLDLLETIAEQYGPARIRLAEPMIATINCTVCMASCLVQATEPVWMDDPRCDDCGGPWPTTVPSSPDSVMELDTADELSSGIVDAVLGNIGLRAGASVVASLRDGQCGLLRIEGDIVASLKRADPLDATVVDV